MFILFLFISHIVLSRILLIEQNIKILNSKLVNKNSPHIIIKYQIQVYY